MLRTYQRRKAAAALLQAEGGAAAAAAAAGPAGAAEPRLLSDSQSSWEWSSQKSSSAACLLASSASQDDAFAEGAAAPPAADHEQEDGDDVDVVPESPEEKARDQNQQCRRRIVQTEEDLTERRRRAAAVLMPPPPPPPPPAAKPSAAAARRRAPPPRRVAQVVAETSQVIAAAEDSKDGFSVVRKQQVQAVAAVAAPMAAMRRAFRSAQSTREKEFGSSKRQKSAGNGNAQPSSSRSAAAASSLMEATESGEVLATIDEANFALEGLKPGQPARAVRSALCALVTLCASATQRRLLRSHGLVTTILKLLVAVKVEDPATAFAAAALVYFLAQDGDAALLFNALPAVRFLVKLLHQCVPADEKPQDKSATAAMKSIKALFMDSTNDDGSQASVSMREVSNAGPAHTLLPDEVVDTRTLALIAVGSGCSEKDVLTVAFVGQQSCDVAAASCSGRSPAEAAEFKDRFREVGGLDDVAQLMADSWCKLTMKQVQSPESALDFDDGEAEPDSATSFLFMLLRCLHILDNASFMNRTSQQHLIDFRVRVTKGIWVPFTGCVLQVLSLRADMSGGAEGDLRNECAVAASKVLLNLTNNSPSGCAQVMANDGMQMLVALLYPINGKAVLCTNIDSQNSVSSLSSESSDIVVAAMGVLVNLVEKDAANRSKLATLHIADETAAPVVDQLVHLFLEYGKGEPVEVSLSHAEMSEWDTFEQGRREAEDSIIAAYSAILLALLASDSSSTRRKVSSMLPGNALVPLVPVLERFLAFHIQVQAFSEKALESMQRLIDSCQLLP